MIGYRRNRTTALRGFNNRIMTMYDHRVTTAQAQIDAQADRAAHFEHISDMMRGVRFDLMKRALVRGDIEGLEIYCDYLGFDLFDWVKEQFNDEDDTNGFALNVRAVFYYRHTYDDSALNDIVNTLIDQSTNWNDLVTAELIKIENEDVIYE